MIDFSSILTYIEVGLFFLALYFLIDFVDAAQNKKREAKIETLLKRLFGKKATKKTRKKRKTKR